jgi:hypothetical protein
MSFLETLAAGVVLAAISALTVVAYRHPQGYRRIAGVFLTLGLFYSWGRIASDLGGINANIQYLADAVQPAQPSMDMIRFVVVRLAANYSDLRWTLVITMVSLVYFVFLLFLPRVLGLLPSTKTRTISEDRAAQ